MATANEQLLSMMNPQQARLLDQQMRGQQVAQRSQGAGMLSGLVQAYTGMADTVQGAAGMKPMGANEMQALKEQKKLEIEKQKKQQVADIMGGAEGANRIEKLRSVANKLRASGTYENLMLAEQFDDKADNLQLEEDKININRTKAQATAAGRGSATDGHLMRDDKGNFYQTFNYKDGLGVPQVKYSPLGGAPEYDGETRLTPVSKSGDSIGMTAEEIVNADIDAKVKIKSKSDFFAWKTEVADDYSTALTQKNTMDRMIELTQQLAASGDLQGGIGAKAQELVYNLTGMRPKNLGELEMLYKVDTLSRLKPLFGSNISDSERNDLNAAFPNILTNGKVNLEKLAVLEKASENAYASANKKMNMTYEEWKEALEGGKNLEKEPEADKPKKTLVWTPDGWVTQ